MEVGGQPGELDAVLRTFRARNGRRDGLKIQIENDRVRVTEWRFAPGAETGWHTHQMDYVVVPLYDGTLRIETTDGRRIRVTATGTLLSAVAVHTTHIGLVGTITALGGDFVNAVGWAGWAAGTEGPMQMLYSCPNVKTTTYGAKINQPPMKAFRAPGFVEGTFSLECLIDELAGTGLKSVRLSGGGDPLAHRDVGRVMDRLHERIDVAATPIFARRRIAFRAQQTAQPRRMRRPPPPWPRRPASSRRRASARAARRRNRYSE